MRKKAHKKTRKTKPQPEATKACSACGADNPTGATSCSKCSKTRFEPAWVRAHRPVNRQFGVQVTSSNPRFGEVKERITLNKWWPGGSSTFHLPNPDQWKQVETIINTQLGPKLGWAKLDDLLDSVTKKPLDDKQRIHHLSKLSSDYPSFLKELVGASQFGPSFQKGL